MEQRLIVEGNDAIYLSTLCQERKISPPKGYENEIKFKKEFVKLAGGKSKVKKVLIEELNSPSVRNIGIVLDADDEKPSDILLGIIHTIESTLGIKIKEETHLTSKGANIILDDLNLKIGIWIMPDNSSDGYLEHFIGNLIPEKDLLLEFAKEKVEELLPQSFSEITKTNQQKAIIHTYLAWKKNPGTPIGQGIKKGYFDIDSKSADSIIHWFKNTFVLAS